MTVRLMMTGGLLKIAWAEWGLSLDENLVPIQVEEDETTPQNDLDINNLNGEGDRIGNGVEHLLSNFDLNLQDYLH